MSYMSAKNTNYVFCIVIQKNGNNDRSNRKKYRSALQKDHSVKTKKKVGRDRRDSSQEEGGRLGFLWVENCGKDAEAKGFNQDGNDLSKGSAWGIDNGFDDHAACGKRRTPKQADGTGCQFLLIVALVDAGAQCPLAKRAALCAGSPAFLKRAWARGMS